TGKLSRRLTFIGWSCLGNTSLVVGFDHHRTPLLLALVLIVVVRIGSGRAFLEVSRVIVVILVLVILTITSVVAIMVDVLERFRSFHHHRLISLGLHLLLLL